MEDRRRFRRIDVDLDGVIRFQQSSDTIGCVIRNINKECMGAMIVASDPRVCSKEDLDLGIFIPADRSPVRCSGRVVWYSEDKKPFKNNTDYAAGIFITNISRMDRRRLELVADRKSMSFGGSLVYSRGFAGSSGY